MDIKNLDITGTVFADFLAEHRWVCFERGSKKPINAHTGGNAQNNQPYTWDTFWTCMDFQKNPYSSDASSYKGDMRDVGGIGIEFGMPARTDKEGNALPATPNRIAGVDLDDVRNPATGEITAEARGIIEDFKTYTEISPSGTGVHMLIKVDDDKWTLAGKKLLLDDASLSSTGKAEIEFYTDARYFTVTGNSLEGYHLPIATGKTTVFERYRDRYIKNEEERKEKKEKERENIRVYDNEEDAGIGVQRPKRSRKGLPVPEGGARSEEEAISILSSWEEYFRAMFEDGNIKPFLAENGNDYSGAELALLRALFTVCQKRALVEQVYYHSPLFTAEREEKWNEVHYRNGETYGHHTMQKAEEDWRASEAKRTVNNEFASEALQLAAINAEEREREKAAVTNLKFSLPAYRAHVEAGKEKRVPTGIQGLDEVLGGGIYPGLVMLGGRTGTGKTTLALQIISGMVAAAGYPVLYVALEMDRHEIAAKCIASIYNKKIGLENYARFIGFGDLLENKQPLSSYSLADAEQEFSHGLGSHLYVLDVTDDRIATEDVEKTAQYIAEIEGRTPIVVIDYLQLLWPEKDRLSDVERANINAYMLKRLNKKYHMPVIILSSFNRASYSLPKTKEGHLTDRKEEEWFEILESAFRDSGNIEFSADILLALRIPYGDPFCIGDKHRKPERLYVLKNRRNPRHISQDAFFYGAGGFFDFSSQPDLWEEEEEDMV